MERNPSDASEQREHILVCLSPSPSNIKIIQTAAKMAAAFNAAFTAIYVQTSAYKSMSVQDSDRLQNNIRFAEKSGAEITTVIGDNIPFQISEFARVSGVTKIIVGRSSTKRNHFWSKPSLTEQINITSPDIDVYIIPDLKADIKYQRQPVLSSRKIIPPLSDYIYSILLLACATGLGILFERLGFSDSNIITIYILEVLINSIVTESPISSAVSSLASTLLFDYFFISPEYSLHTYESDYIGAFAIMITVSLIIGSLAGRLKENARQSARTAYRTKVLFDTDQYLQKAGTDDEIIKITADQVILLLHRSIIIYQVKNDKLCEGVVFNSEGKTENDRLIFDESEHKIAEWVFKNKHRAGASTDFFSDAKSLYLAIRINGNVYGVVGIEINSKPLETYEYSVLMSILGECALALENLQNVAEKEQARLVAQKEKLRANLLRSISHDLRTPLTSISGNASNLLSQYKYLDDTTREQMFSDIYDDSQWLIALVENLLSITRIEDGRMALNMTTELIGDVIEEAIKHINRNSVQHTVTVTDSDELLLAKMDSRLIIQVLINLINNAINYTQIGSEINISYESRGDYIEVSVSDNGPGISDENKPRIFEMFYTGQNKISDSTRSLGLGLGLCKSIVEAHSGALTVSDNSPTGSIFTFTLPAERVIINE